MAFHVRPYANTGALLESPEQVIDGRVGHRATYLALPQIDKDVIGIEFAQFVNQVIAIQTYELGVHVNAQFISFNSLRACLVGVIVARHNPDLVVPAPEIAVAQSQSVPDTHSGVRQEAHQQLVPQVTAGSNYMPQLIVTECSRNRRMALQLDDPRPNRAASRDVMQKRLVRPTGLDLELVLDLRSHRPGPRVIHTERGHRRNDGVDRRWLAFFANLARLAPCLRPPAEPTDKSADVLGRRSAPVKIGCHQVLPVELQMMRVGPNGVRR